GPVMRGREVPHPRKLYWRYKAGSQRAVRDGDSKYLRIAGNEFLFDVIKDPRERANLKDRHREVFDRLKSDWEAWNDTMLPERPRPATYGNPGNFVADHYGVTNPAPAVPSVSPPTRCPSLCPLYRSKADIVCLLRYVSFVPKADKRTAAKTSAIRSPCRRAPATSTAR